LLDENRPEALVSGSRSVGSQIAQNLTLATPKAIGSSFFEQCQF
jgi:hypothetical protein